jgi:hypothetical protein
MSNDAQTTVDRAELAGERGLCVQIGMATKKAQGLDDTLGDVIPGVSALLGSARRIVLVTDTAVHLYRGRRADRPEAPLGVYPLGDTEILFDGAKLVFPDGQVVFMTSYQAGQVLRHAAVDNRQNLAADLVRRLGIVDEVGIAVEAGKSLSKTDRLATVVERVADVVIDGEISRERVGEGRIVLVTDRHVRLYRGDRVADLGPLLATFPAGQTALICEADRVSFPDGEVIRFSEETAHRLCGSVPQAGKAHNDGR